MLRDKPWTYPVSGLPSAEDRALGMEIGQVQLVMLPLHHTGFTKLHHGLALDHTIVLMSRFDAELALRLIERHRVAYFPTVPTMMRRILDVPGVESFDLTSVKAVHHGSTSCPPDVKRAWLRLFGPETTFEGYSSQERIGAVWIRGDDWLEHPGSVGRPSICDVRIRADGGGAAAVGEVGEIYFRAPFTKQPVYLGAGDELPEWDGYLSMRDMGSLDARGYLHVVGRRTEVIDVAGAKVYPTEVEHVLMRMSSVRDAVVVGRPHDVSGQAVHALVEPADPDTPPSEAELDEHCRTWLEGPKVPASYAVVDKVPRADTDKIRRSALARCAEPPAGDTPSSGARDDRREG